MVVIAPCGRARAVGLGAHTRGFRRLGGHTTTQPSSIEEEGSFRLAVGAVSLAGRSPSPPPAAVPASP